MFLSQTAGKNQAKSLKVKFCIEDYPLKNQNLKNHLMVAFWSFKSYSSKGYYIFKEKIHSSCYSIEESTKLSEFCISVPISLMSMQIKMEMTDWPKFHGVLLKIRNEYLFSINCI